MTNRSKSRGTAAEREVVRYLQNWWPAAERRALSGSRDRGDVAGIPGVVVEVKAAATQLIGAWQRETMVEMRNAGAAACLLVVKRPYKTAARWDAYFPIAFLPSDWSYIPEGEESSWVRMDLLAAALLLRAQGY
ncbi:hypothetical protein ACFPM3_20335 [Streptomyces coeruleoprunus]|uniref:Holliday junction resolvase n=1 Tax=Streptomyces coeruleoprunus TaxID=285563 RepID=A0ABV9XGE5_9ACTN